MPKKPSKPRLSAQQQAIRRGSGVDPQRQILYKTHRGPQTDFMQTQAEEVLYGGAYAGGKSFALRAWAVTYAMTYPGALIGLFRKSFRELEDTHALTLQQEVPLSVATYASGAHNLIFKNGSIIQLRYCETDADVSTYQTSEFDALLLDELTQFTEYQYSGLISRCRSAKPWWPGPRIRAGATPLDIGHQWVKERWITPTTPNEIWKAPASEGGFTRQFIPAKLTDNPTLMKADPTYLDRLRALPEEEYAARALGSWDVFTGQYFTRWRDSIHVEEPFDIPVDWDKYLCVDYGHAAPYACLWFARPPETQTAWFYREQYGKGVDLKEQVYRAWQATGDEKLKAIILDPSMFAKVNVKGDRVDAMSEEWKRVFGNTANVIKGDNARISGWRLLREMVEWKESPNGGVLVPPRFHAFNTCSNLVRTLPLLISDKNNLEDVDSDGEDHAADAARYGLRHAFEGGGKLGRTRRYYLTPQGIRSKT